MWFDDARIEYYAKIWGIAGCAPMILHNLYKVVIVLFSLTRFVFLSVLSAQAIYTLAVLQEPSG